MSVSEAAQLRLELGDFDGSLDVLVDLARRQKIDVARLSVAALVEQYLAFVAAHHPTLELSADYLVLAAWFAYLKSCLLVPAPPEDAPEPEDVAWRHAHRSARLAAMRSSAAVLAARPRLGRDMFARAAPEGLATTARRAPPADLGGLLAAYGAVRARGRRTGYAPHVRAVVTLDAALELLARMLPAATDWTPLDRFAPPSPVAAMRRSGRASMAGAALEMARLRRIELRQPTPDAAIELRAR